MIIGLKISGFKNLVDVDVRFGPLTCIAGPNTVGKSNLFDAIRFLSYLANLPLLEAASLIRAGEGRTGDIKDLFHCVGDEHDNKMSFAVEMIIPHEGVDDLGQKAEATITFVRYSIEIGYREDSTSSTLGSLELLREELEPIRISDAHKKIKFQHKPDWRNSVLIGKRGIPFISTGMIKYDKIIKLHQDGSRGRPKELQAKDMPRTVLSTVNAIESPTALIVRREMQSWRLLQLEPRSLREPDRFTTPPGLLPNGSHLPATIYSMARHYENSHSINNSTFVYDQITNRLSELIDDVYELYIDADKSRELLTLRITDRNGTNYPARSLSDGTLRFLALSVIALDPKTNGLIYMEEPENGIHPKRIPAMLRLLEDIACDAENPAGKDNPLRQVIFNTHSPDIVNLLPDNTLLVAELKEKVKDQSRFKGVWFSWLSNTWRAKADPSKHPIAKGELLNYLRINPSIDFVFNEDQNYSEKIKRLQDHFEEIRYTT